MKTIPKCPNCSVPYIEHLGVHGLCAKLQEANERTKVMESRIATLEGYLETTADGVLVREAESLHCPKCGNAIPESDQYLDFLQCWNCTNPDNFNESPLPLLYCSCLAKKATS